MELEIGRCVNRDQQTGGIWIVGLEKNYKDILDGAPNESESTWNGKWGKTLLKMLTKTKETAGTRITAWLIVSEESRWRKLRIKTLDPQKSNKMLLDRVLKNTDYG